MSFSVRISTLWRVRHEQLLGNRLGISEIEIQAKSTTRTVESVSLDILFVPIPHVLVPLTPTFAFSSEFHRRSPGVPLESQCSVLEEI